MKYMKYDTLTPYSKTSKYFIVALLILKNFKKMHSYIYHRNIEEAITKTFTNNFHLQNKT